MRCILAPFPYFSIQVFGKQTHGIEITIKFQEKVSVKLSNERSNSLPSCSLFKASCAESIVSSYPG